MKIILIIIGLLLLTPAGFTAFQSKRLLNEGIISTGKVVSFDVKHKKDKKKDRTMYYPLISFQDGKGNPIEFKSNTGSNPKSYTSGENVEFINKINNANNARINSFTSMWLMPLILGITRADHKVCSF